MKIFNRLHILAMGLPKSMVERRLESKGEFLDDGTVCHICKVILWYGLDESWYNTIARDMRYFATMKVKTFNGKIPEKWYKEKLFGLRCEDKEDLKNTLYGVKAEFEGERGSNGREYPKARNFNIDKVWTNFQKFRDNLIEISCSSTPENILTTLSKEVVKNLCEKYFKEVI